MFKRIKHDGLTSVYCDSEMHIEVTDPAHAHSGLPHEIKLARCTCEAPALKSAEEFDNL